MGVELIAPNPRSRAMVLLPLSGETHCIFMLAEGVRHAVHVPGLHPCIDYHRGAKLPSHSETEVHIFTAARRFRIPQIRGEPGRPFQGLEDPARDQHEPGPGPVHPRRRLHP